MSRTPRETTMDALPLVSILINNYNYGRFVAQAVESALLQTYPRVEVIVVDDGSTDDSPAVLEPYRHRLKLITKPNGGQASAMNLGFAHSHGDIVHFLDSDDLIFPSAMAEVVQAFSDPRVIKVHWPLAIIDESGRATGQLKPSDPLASGDLSGLLHDCLEHLTPPQSGNAWTRAFLTHMLPIDEHVYRTGGSDTFLSLLTLPFGHLAALPTPQGAYRYHSASRWNGVELLHRLPLGVQRYAHACHALATICHTHGWPADPSRWIQTSWLYRFNEFVQQICSTVADGQAFALIDEDSFGLPSTIGQRRRFSFTDCNGQFNGPPLDSAAAIHELERLRSQGAAFLVIASWSFWWLDYYAAFRDYLDTRFTRIVADERMVVYRLTTSSP
jgi:glycosyltransferase involved in cell wall biosynthesis